MDMRGKHIVLYSSSLAFVLAAFSAWLTLYMQNPAAANPAELYAIQDSINEIVQERENMNTVIPKPVPVEIDTVMAWWYPGEPACSAVTEAKALNLDIVKPEYFVIRDGGVFEFMTEEKYGCNGYSKKNIEAVKKLADRQFVMVSASYAQDMDIFLKTDEETNRYTNQLVAFAVNENFTGVELDFEDFGGWTPEIYTRYKAFVSRLGTELRQNGKELMIDLPAVRSVAEENWYVLRMADLERLPVDYFVIMGYDYQYDHGVGESVAPLEWLAEVVLFAQQRIEDDSKLVIGIPSYGYIGNLRTGKIEIVTEEQARKHPLYSQAKRLEESQEYMAKNRTEVLVFQDSVSIDAKVDTVAKNGIGKVSIWHLGGNPSFQD